MECGFTLNGFTVNGSLLVLPALSVAEGSEVEGLPFFGVEACLRTISALEPEQAPVP